MIKRTIDISDGPTFAHIQDDQLVLERAKQPVATIPCEDVGVLLIDHHSMTLSAGSVVRLAQHGAAVVFCDQRHLPVAMALPMEANGLVAERIRMQSECSLPTKKRLWRQIVQEKIRRQADNLDEASPTRLQMLSLAEEVRSGDASNCEGRAAAMYWPAFMGGRFRRDPEGESPNGLLNYGYMVMRAAVARALVVAGLTPALGLYHRNRSNAFCLADDMVEVLRPRIDRTVRECWREGRQEVDKQTKERLLGLLRARVQCEAASGPLLVALHRMAFSLVECLGGKRSKLLLPAWLETE